MNTGLTYSLFYDVLLNLRQAFYTNGRIDDSNAKLDEIMKVLIISYYEAKKNNRFSLSYVKSKALELYGNENKTAKTLRFLFETIVNDSMFFNEDGTNIFGVNPTLVLPETEDNFADILINEISKIDFLSLLNEGIESDFDIINECFGHFVRDNFRNNKEDGQYMTPGEITEPILNMVFSDIFNEEDFIKNIIDNDYKFTIMDPTCGVGTLLVESFRKIQEYIHKADIDEEVKSKIIRNLKQQCLVGQDKIDRMVRLSKINMMLLGANISNISIGNSIIGDSRINKYMGNVDLIFNNPPFGAECDVNTLKGDERYPIISTICRNINNINSELAMLDKSISLLKPKGRLVIILPDSVVSAKGIYADFREQLLKICEIKAIIELPSVTFAQAGTRTKAVVMYLQKKSSEKKEIFMGVCEKVGYVVKERGGVPIKIEDGSNEMYDIANAYMKRINLRGEQFRIINDQPSATMISYNYIIDDILTPNFYNASRLNSINKLKIIDDENFEIRRLDEIVDFDTTKRKSYYTDEKINHISILHINSDGIIDLEQARKFKPISKGRICMPGDILFSKINPRIPRVAVLPDTGEIFVCSNEFEILRVKDSISPYLIGEVLKLTYVREQIESLTSGTSSSHNRIKTEQLRKILIPFPKKNGKLDDMYESIGKKIEEYMVLKYKAQDGMKKEIMALENIIC